MHQPELKTLVSACPSPTEEASALRAHRLTDDEAAADPAPRIAPTDLLLSLVVVVHRMSRPAMRTLRSLQPDYQQGLRSNQYEVLIYENASQDPLTPDFIAGLPPNFRHTWLEPGAASPVFALNRGLREARGAVVGSMIDGARIVTPGLLHKALMASRVHPRSVITTMGWYLGCDLQGVALGHGHSPDGESRLLASIGWPEQPYRLFEIATQDQSSVDGWVARISESNALFMPAALWSELGGYEPRFTSAGGGLANLDLLRRACDLPEVQHVLLCDEATFHQAHGGVSTNADAETHRQRGVQWRKEYLAIRGEAYRPADQRTRLLFGEIRPEFSAQLASALLHPLRSQVRQQSLAPAYLHDLRQRPVRRLPVPAVEDNRAGTSSDALSQYAQSLFTQRRFLEVRDICRLALRRQGHGSEPMLERMLQLCANVTGPSAGLPRARRARHLAAMARAMELLGETEQAEHQFAESLDLLPTLDEARSALARLRMPGQDYLARLSDLHDLLRPEIYLEIGVFKGQSMALAGASTLAIGVDPRPCLSQVCLAQVHLHPVASDVFFDQHAQHSRIPGAVNLGFIDGLHDVFQVIRDLWNLEASCAPDAIIAVHDTLPLDALSASRARETGFWTGDVWKVLPLLQCERPDLAVVTIPTPPSGLTLIAGFGRRRDGLGHAQAEAIARNRYGALSFSDFDCDWRPGLAMIDNSRDALERWLLEVRQPMMPAR